MANDDTRELAELIAKQPEGTELARVDGVRLGSVSKSRVEAVMFIPDGVDPSDALDIRVVGVDPKVLEAMAARRC